jgi:hypothetical protein
VGEHEARGTQAAPSRAPVKAGAPLAKPPTFTPARYLQIHASKVWQMVGRYLDQVSMVEPAPGVGWRDEKAFIAATVKQLQRMDLFTRRESLMEVTYPADPYFAIQDLLPRNDSDWTPTLTTEWVPTIGTALGQVFEQAIARSLQRLGPRWAELAQHSPRAEALGDERLSLVAAESLVASAPIDLAVRRGLTVSAVVELTKAYSKPGKSKPRLLRPVRLEWLGATDPALWNWVRSDPKDATVEEVAASLWHGSKRQGFDGPASFYAYGLVAMAGMFGLPPSWARTFAEARAYAPAKADHEEKGAQLVALASSRIADELALAQVDPREKGEGKSVLETLGDAAIQLEFLHKSLAAWNLSEDVAIAQRWVATKHGELAAASEPDRNKWAPVLEAQRARLRRIADGVRQIAAADPAARSSEPVRRILATYARASATSFLGSVSEHLIASAAAEQTMLPITALRASSNDLAVVVGSGEGVNAKQFKEAEDLSARARLLQSKALAGKPVDTDDVELTTLALQELTLHLRVAESKRQLEELERLAIAAGKGFMNGVVDGFRRSLIDLSSNAASFRNHLRMVESDWNVEAGAASSIRDPREHALVTRRLRREALARAQHRFAEIKNDGGLVDFLKGGASVIERHQHVVGWVETCVKILALIGVGFVAAAGRAVVARVVSSWGAGAEAVGTMATLARGAAQVGGQVAGIATDAAINTVGQHALGVTNGNSFAQGFLENLLVTVGSGAILSKIGKELEFAQEVQRRTASLWRDPRALGTTVLAHGLTLSSHVFITAAVSYVAQQVIKGGNNHPTNSQLTDWFMQGVSIAIARYVHGKVSARRESLAKLATLKGVGEAKQVLADADLLLQLSASTEARPNEKMPFELLGRLRKLIADNLAILEAATKHPDRLRSLELTEATVNAARRQLANAMNDFPMEVLVELPLRAGGLEELVPGSIWSGTRSQIERAFGAAKRAGVPINGGRETNGVWRLKIGTREVELHERSVNARLPRTIDKEKHANAHGQDPDPKATTLIRKVGQAKAFGEQHAHAPGSVPLGAVFELLGEFQGITHTQRTDQIALLNELIREFTTTKDKPRDAQVSDLSKGGAVVRDGVVRAPDKITIASVAGKADLGMLNKLLQAKETLQIESEPAQRRKALETISEELERYRKLIVMRKPDAARYDASINTTNEFFVRYKLLAAAARSENRNKQHLRDLTNAEISARRPSARQLGMQELRFGSKGNTIDEIQREAENLLQNAPRDADVSLTFATTKKRLANSGPQNEQRLTADLVRAYYERPTIERAFNAIEAAGVENVGHPPALIWEAAAQRTFRNAIRVRERLAEALPSRAETVELARRVARVAGIDMTRAETLLQRYRSATYEDAIAAVDQRATQLRRAGQPTLPQIDPVTKQVTERFSGMTLDSVAHETRIIVESLRAWSAETGRQHGDVNLLGLTMHAGEQVMTVDPFVLLEQVDQAVSLGVDRIGHALIIAIDGQVLVAKGRLRSDQLGTFTARQHAVVNRIRERGVTIEANLSSNTEISNLTHGEHPAGKFARSKLRVSVNTDDETVLATTIQQEFDRVSRARGVTRHDIAAMILEAYRSRMGNRELGQRGRIKPQLVAAFLDGLSQPEAQALASHLANYFHVAHAGSPRDTIIRVVDTALGL